MRSFNPVCTMFLYAIFIALGLLTGPDGRAVAQETQSGPQLERIDVEATQRRPAARTTTAPRSGADYDEPIPPTPSSEDRGEVGQIFSGSGIPASTLSGVTEKSEVSLGAAALPSQVDIVTAQDIQRLNIQTYADLFRRVPGISAFSYGQGQIGEAIQIRGFYGSSGADTALFIDGVPQTFPSCAQGSAGSSDMYWLSPELIERIEIIKGPISALYGDFALAGVVNIVTKKSEPCPSVNSYGGSFGAFRALGVLSVSEMAGLAPLLTGEYYTIAGYRDNSQLKRWSPFAKVSMPLWGGILSLRYNYYQSDWGAPGYLRIEELKKGRYNRTHAVNTSDGGDQQRYEVVMNYAPICGERGLYATFYVDNYHIIRFATFLPSTQWAREDDRVYWGGRAYYNLVFGKVANLTVGGETRHDNGHIQQYNQINRQWMSQTYYYEMNQSNWSWFLQGQIKPTESLKFVGGMRGDYFSIRADNTQRPQNSGIGFPTIVSQKIGAVLTPTRYLNIFGNIGSGFRSPDVRELSPYQANSQKNFDLEVAKIDTADVGFNVALFGNLYLAADYYHTIMQREIRIVNNQPVNIGDTVRKGYEFEVKYYPSKAINIFANYAWVDARVINPTTAGQTLVANVPEHIIKGGVEIQQDFGGGRKLLADAYYQYVSGAPNYKGTSTISVMAPDYDVYNFKLTYQGNGWQTFGTVRCQPREYSAPYAYVSNSYLVYDPPPKWEFTGGLTYSFW